MKYTSPVYSAASGSIAGIVYSHNAGGLYTRARAIPVQPNTVQQQAVKSNFALISTRWAETLTPAQRAEWDNYAASVGLVNSLGATIYVTGRAHYIRGNAPRLLALLGVADAGPTELSLPSFTPPTGVITAATDVIAVTFTATDEWAAEAGGAMLIFTSRPVPATVNSFAGPYRYASKIVGAVIPPTSPAEIPLSFPVVAGQKVYWRAVIVRADGRLSSSFRSGSLAV